MTRIRKTSNTRAIAGKALNVPSESTTDTYSCDYLNNIFTLLEGLIITDTQRSDTCSLVANGKNTFNINVERTGYTPLGVLFIDSTNNDIAIMKYSQFGNTVYVRLLNTSNSNIEFTINVKVLYKKD